MASRSIKHGPFYAILQLMRVHGDFTNKYARKLSSADFIFSLHSQFPSTLYLFRERYLYRLGYKMWPWKMSGTNMWCGEMSCIHTWTKNILIMFLIG
jgi:hypothetical protein